MLPEEYEYTIEDLVTQIRQLEELLIIKQAKPLQDCLLLTLTWLAKRFGYVKDQKMIIDLKLTHQDLADLIGSNRVTVTHLLKQLEQDQKIERTDKDFILIPINNLALRNHASKHSQGHRQPDSYPFY